MKQRQRKRAETLEEKHRIEREQELARQQQERDKLNEKLARIIEKSALVENVKVKIYLALCGLVLQLWFYKKKIITCITCAIIWVLLVNLICC